MKNFEIKKILDHKKIVEIIDRINFFSEFTDSEKNRISQFYKHITIYKANSCIIQQSEDSTSFHILLCGKAIVTKEYEQKTIHTLHPGDVFGEISFLTKSKRTANVIATEESITLELDKEFLDQMGAGIREKIKDKLILNLITLLDSKNSSSDTKC